MQKISRRPGVRNFAFYSLLGDGRRTQRKENQASDIFGFEPLGDGTHRPPLSQYWTTHTLKKLKKLNEKQSTAKTTAQQLQKQPHPQYLDLWCSAFENTGIDWRAIPKSRFWFSGNQMDTHRARTPKIKISPLKIARQNIKKKKRAPTYQT